MNALFPRRRIMRTRLMMISVLAAAAVSGTTAMSVESKDPPAKRDQTEQTAASKVAPIVVKPGAKFERDFRAAHAAWTERVVLAPFRKRAAGTPNAAAIPFVESALEEAPFGSCFGYSDELAAEANRLLAAGADDPLVIHLAAGVLTVVEDREDEKKKRMEQAADGAEKLELSPAVCRILAMAIANERHKHVDQKKWDMRAGEWALAAIEDGSYGPEDGAIFIRHNLGCYGRPHLDRTPEALQLAASSEKLPEWTRRTMLGIIEHARAWQERGGGYANTVTPKGWLGFEKHLERARVELVKAWELEPSQPYAAAAMITNVMGGGGQDGETERLWFDRAVAAQFDYMIAYHSLMTSWRPRWGGSHRLLYDFGRACRASGRYDTDVPRVFTHALTLIDEDHEDRREVYRSGQFPDIQAEMVDHHRKLLAEPTREAERWMDRSFFAVNAWLVGAYDAADEALRELPDGLYPPVVAKLRRLSRSATGFRAEVALMNSQAQESYVRAEDLWVKQDFTAARPHFETALSKAPPEGRSLIEGRLDAIKLKAEFEKGDWVTLPVRPNLPGWRVVYGEWEGNQAGELIIHGSGSKGLILYELSPAPNYEMRAEVRTDGPAEIDRSAGLALANHGYKDHRTLVAAFWQDRKRNRFQAGLLRTFGLTKAPVITVEIGETNQLHVQVRDNLLTFRVNDTEVFRDHEPDRAEPSASETVTGLGTFEFNRGVKTIFSNIQLRKLPDQ